MGRLPCVAGNDPCPNNAASQDPRRVLEDWRHRPDLCLVWVAFCAPSTLTLADGVRLAKTRRCSSEVLKLLAGVGLTNSEADTTHQQDKKEEPSTKASSQDGEQHWRTPRHVDANQSKFLAVHNVEPLSSLRTDSSPINLCSQMGLADVQPASGSDHGVGCKLYDADPAYFRRCVDVVLRPWISCEFTTVARLTKSVHGEVRHLIARDGVHVVAKVVPAAAMGQSTERGESEQSSWFRSDELPNIEDPLNELAVLTYLQRSCEQCSHVIRLHGAFQDAACAYLLTEFCEGGELFERVAYGDPLSDGEKQRCISQLLQAVHHLHRHNVGHRDISLENVLLRRDGDCVLMDFGQAVRLRAPDGGALRYFAEAGKRAYRAPEMYVPRERPIQVVCPQDAAPGSVAQVSYDRCRCEVLLPPDAAPSRPCAAEPHGYAAAPADVFACGVCAFVLLVGKPPWAVAWDGDPGFSFVRRHGLPNLLHQWRGGGFYRPGTPPSDEERLLAQMLRVNPTQRPGADECFCSPWLASAAPAWHA